MRTALRCAILAPLVGAGCSRAHPPAAVEIVIAAASPLPSDPTDPAWESAPEYVAALLPQDLVEPRRLTPATTRVRIRALSDGAIVAFRLQWADATKSDLPGASRFCDACAVQLPAKSEPDVPAPQMGEANRPVEITFWSAAWQAAVDGRGDSLADLYPNAAVDHYPFEAPSLAEGSAAWRDLSVLYAPARALGNPGAGPRAEPVEELNAEGPGTIVASDRTGSRGCGRWSGDGWSVAIARKLPAGLSGSARGQVAFAVWEGSHEEAGARKGRTDWIPLALGRKP